MQKRVLELIERVANEEVVGQCKIIDHYFPPLNISAFETFDAFPGDLG